MHTNLKLFWFDLHYFTIVSIVSASVAFLYNFDYGMRDVVHGKRKNPGFPDMGQTTMRFFMAP